MDSLAAPTINDRDFHIAKPVYAERSVRRALKEGRLTQDDVDLFYEFITELQASQGISDIRKNKLVYFFVSWRRFLPPYRENGIAQIYQGISAIKNATNLRGRPFKQNTVNDHIILIKRFYLWMIENGYSDIPEKKLRKIRAPGACALGCGSEPPNAATDFQNSFCTTRSLHGPAEAPQFAFGTACKDRQGEGKMLPLPGILDHREFTRATVQLGRCRICGEGKAVYQSKDLRTCICEACYARLVREWNAGMGCADDRPPLRFRSAAGPGGGTGDGRGIVRLGYIPEYASRRVCRMDDGKPVVGKLRDSHRKCVYGRNVRILLDFCGYWIREQFFFIYV